MVVRNVENYHKTGGNILPNAADNCLSSRACLQRMPFQKVCSIDKLFMTSYEFLFYGSIN